ncbi:MAG: 4Fe-4S dicluster domain-containing protein [Candidatus Cloacimonetes bacterium]|nr:4Fe-4S dicluster domain-containing protein [Candidatus Cloacimonadota bacterium]
MPKKLKFDYKGSEFLDKIVKLSGEIITLCDQCGTCSAGCPFVEEMDITPSQIMRKVLIGDMEVMDSQTMWICASCFTCTVRCPRKLDVSKVSEALRQVKLRQAVDKMDISDISAEEAKRLPVIGLVSSFRKLTG